MDGEGRPADFPDNLPPVNTTENNGEVSLSIEETNKLRIALGLKPLSLEPKKPPPPKVQDAPQAKTSADDIKAKIEQARQRRKEQELRAVKALGAADEGDDDDDLYSWAQRIRPDAEPAEDDASQGRKKARHGHDSDEDMEEAEEQGMTAEELARLKVKHDYGELAEGESVILTLADKAILDEKGNLDEDEGAELENVLLAEQKRRSKAYEAAEKKSKPLFEEDGKKRSLLDKYDEEEELALELSAIAGEAAKQRHQEEVRKKLAEGAESVLGAKPALDGGADFMSAEEAKATFQKPKRRKKKLRVKEEKLDLDLLEEQAAAEGGGTDLGSRASRLAAREKALEEEQQQRLDKAARFEAAVDKANWASAALRETKPEPVLVLGDDADDELQESLARARRAALQQTTGAEQRLKEVAERIAVKREADEQESIRAAGKNDLEFTETTEFVRSIQSAEEGGTAKEEEEGYMGVEEEEPAPAPSVPPPESKKQRKRGRVGAWVSTDDMEVDEQAEVKEEPREEAVQKKQKSKEEEELEGITAQQLVGKGLAATLSLLKDTGSLTQKMEWAGRTNDKKKNKLIGLDDVYSGGASEDRIARDIEVALTQRDQFGRILTPKERFRELSYKFHGKAPSKNKLEKKLKQAREEIATKRAATSENPSSQLGMLKQVQQQQGVPYVVLSGPKATMPPPAPKGGKPPSKSSARDVSKGNIPLTPVLGGGLTPLTDPTKKVEMMYGIKKPGGSGTGSMGPPPPRKPHP